MHFTTKVILPESSLPEFPLLINKFETDVVNTAHRVGDLNEKVLFQFFLLKGSNGRIDVQVNFYRCGFFILVMISYIFFYPQSVKADQGIISTSNAGIQGIFNTSKFLSLHTSNGRIDVDVGLSSVDESEPGLNLATTNAYVF